MHNSSMMGWLEFFACFVLVLVIAGTTALLTNTVSTRFHVHHVSVVTVTAHLHDVRSVGSHDTDLYLNSMATASLDVDLGTHWLTINWLCHAWLAVHAWLRLMHWLLLIHWLLLGVASWTTYHAWLLLIYRLLLMHWLLLGVAYWSTLHLDTSHLNGSGWHVLNLSLSELSICGDQHGFSHTWNDDFELSTIWVPVCSQVDMACIFSLVLKQVPLIHTTSGAHS